MIAAIAAAALAGCVYDYPYPSSSYVGVSAGTAYGYAPPRVVETQTVYAPTTYVPYAYAYPYTSSYYYYDSGYRDRYNVSVDLNYSWSNYPYTGYWKNRYSPYYYPYPVYYYDKPTHGKSNHYYPYPISYPHGPYPGTVYPPSPPLKNLKTGSSDWSIKPENYYGDYKGLTTDRMSNFIHTKNSELFTDKPSSRIIKNNSFNPPTAVNPPIVSGPPSMPSPPTMSGPPSLPSPPTMSGPPSLPSGGGPTGSAGSSMPSPPTMSGPPSLPSPPTMSGPPSLPSGGGPSGFSGSSMPSPPTMSGPPSLPSPPTMSGPPSLPGGGSFGSASRISAPTFGARGRGDK